MRVFWGDYSGVQNEVIGGNRPDLADLPQHPCHVFRRLPSCVFTSENPLMRQEPFSLDQRKAAHQTIVINSVTAICSILMTSSSHESLIANNSRCSQSFETFDVLTILHIPETSRQIALNTVSYQLEIYWLY